MRSSSFFTLLLTALVVKGDKTFSLDINTGTFAPDSFSTGRTAISVNGNFGAPLLAVQKNDRILANVSNNLNPNSTEIDPFLSIHWHGMFQHRTATEDGVDGVTQCPIVPGTSYNYNFSTAGQTGTYWYHSHVGTQYCDGLRGPLVIYDPNDPQRDLYHYDNETTVMQLSDWYHTPSGTLFNSSNSTVAAPTPDSILFNDLGVISGTSTNRKVFTVDKSKRYRFRVINVSCFASFNLSFDGHSMTVIETDGVATHPLPVDSLQIFAGQRYSVIVEANQIADNYWIRAIPTPLPNRPDNPDYRLFSAILRYNGANATNPTSTSHLHTPLVESNIHPLDNMGSPGGSAPPDVAINLVLQRNAPKWALAGTINNASGQTNQTGSFFPPKNGTEYLPVLLQILNGVDPAKFLPPGDVYTLPPNKIIEVSIPGGGDFSRAHPFHLHGHHFDIVKSADQVIPNYVNPPRRDVVGVYGGNVTFRFKTDNPGPWILHCHIDWHLAQGMAVVFAEDPAGQREGNGSVIIPPAFNQVCENFNNYNHTGAPGAKLLGM